MGCPLPRIWQAAGVRFRIFGQPMGVWRNHMPEGMRLKSEGFASSLSDPRGNSPCDHYCQDKGIKYEDVGEPVHIETFISYGLEFQTESSFPILKKSWLSQCEKLR